MLLYFMAQKIMDLKATDGSCCRPAKKRGENPIARHLRQTKRNNAAGPPKYTSNHDCFCFIVILLVIPTTTRTAAATLERRKPR